MSLFIVNALLAFLWVLLWGDLSLYTLLVGFVFGYLTLLLFARIRGRDTLWNAYGSRLFAIVGFSAYFLGLLVKSNWQIAKEILTPGLSIKPRIFRYEVTGLGEVEVVAFANAITLTPGTLVVDIRTHEDGTAFLYIHGLFAEDREATVQELDDLRDRMKQDVFPLPATPSEPGRAVA